MKHNYVNRLINIINQIDDKINGIEYFLNDYRKFRENLYGDASYVSEGGEALINGYLESRDSYIKVRVLIFEEFPEVKEAYATQKNNIIEQQLE